VGHATLKAVPTAQMDCVIEKLQSKQVFTTLDLTNGFFHVPVLAKQYTKVYIGITNSPAVFIRFIMAVMRDSIKNEDAVVYMDDVIISSKSIDEGVQKLKRVLKVAQGNGLRINWNVCQVLKRKVNFLGYVVESSTIKHGNEKTQAVADFPIPRDKKGVQRFLGLTSYFRRLVDGYAVISKPSIGMLRKEVRFEFQNQQLAAFKKLREALISGPVLKLYNHSLDTEIHTDASKFGLGAVLLQRDPCDNLWHPVFYMSRKTKPCEEKYHSYELQVLAVIGALVKWRVYVLRKKFEIITDCNAFTMTMKKKEYR